MKRYDSERALLDDFMTSPASPASPLALRRTCEECGEPLPEGASEQKRFCGGACRKRAERHRAEPPGPPRPVPTRSALELKADEIASLFEDITRTPNLILFREPDDPLSKADWRKAAKLAGELLNHEVTVATTRFGRTFATLIPTPEEMKAEGRRATLILDAVLSGEPKPPPLPRVWR